MSNTVADWNARSALPVHMTVNTDLALRRTSNDAFAASPTQPPFFKPRRTTDPAG